MGRMVVLKWEALGNAGGGTGVLEGRGERGQTCHVRFLSPSRSFSGVSPVNHSLAVPVPLVVMAATWKLYWLPFSRPEATRTRSEHCVSDAQRLFPQAK